MQTFNNSFSYDFFYKGYRLLAADGSDIHYPTNPAETENYFSVPDGRGYNLMHLNALYDIWDYIAMTTPPGFS